MERHLKKLLKKYNLKLELLPIKGDGYILPSFNKNDKSKIIVNQSYNNEQIENVILHEIGHAKNDDDCIDYKDNYRTRLISEHEAKKFSIHEKVKQFVAYGNEVNYANYVNVAEWIGIDDYSQVKKELSKYILK